MNRWLIVQVEIRQNFPRASGDEPPRTTKRPIQIRFSPREWG